MVQAIEAPESVRKKVSFSVFGFLNGEVSLKVQPLVYFMERRLMLLSSEFSVSNLKYKISNQSILHSKKLVMVIQYWRSKIGHMHPTIRTAMMMGKKWQQTRFYYTINTIEYNQP
ncbi:hypothetical protein PVK06_026541 [Gossypium arboreum]|uniref:Uncharacterized protein n=1 Tax=Gossypium arboreum TaxID=29729 RepID=A0ABR0NXZ3_GOSAR|nr:hypothetical protein PVK06_026541 [Gossypium arboreum]